MTLRRYLDVNSATVIDRPGGAVVEIPEDGSGVIYEWHCDVAIACDGGPRPKIEHQLDLSVGGPGYPTTRANFSACAACCKLIVPNPVRLTLAAFGVDLPPGLQPDR